LGLSTWKQELPFPETREDSSRFRAELTQFWPHQLWHVTMTSLPGVALAAGHEEGSECDLGGDTNLRVSEH
jgi:hypothetical protein